MKRETGNVKCGTPAIGLFAIVQNAERETGNVKWGTPGISLPGIMQNAERETRLKSGPDVQECDPPVGKHAQEKPMGMLVLATMN